MWYDRSAMPKYLKTFIVLFSLIFLGIGCAPDPYDSGFDYGSGSQGPDDDSGIMDDVPDEEETGDDGSGVKFDVGHEEKTNPCEKVDFLFIIDNSGSMNDNQINLINNFQQFVDGIIQLTETGDFHIGIITTDDYSHNSLECGVIGGLVVQTGGNNASNTTCGPWSEGNYMITAELASPDGFSCAAKVGTSGSGSEKHLEALISSLGLFLNSPGQCNDGFYRDDSKLVVIFISDEEDNSLTSLNWWLSEFEFYMTQQDKNLEDVVMLGLVPMPQSTCASSSDTKLKDFVTSFPFSYLGDVCHTDYSIFFTDALETIDAACTPVG